ncbi:MAG: ATP-dependent helicase, partial [Symploca sp. SIO2E6]|nr:ATP-dependent helicase [Symploca sp. SIO2E6]
MTNDKQPTTNNKQQTTNNQQPTTNNQQQILQQLRDSLRQGQQSMADWRGGQLAVSAVPGAGKSTGMAVAAAIAIARYRLHAKRQLVVVTFTRSAAASIKAKIRAHLNSLSIPQNSFVVHTLHGLALNIANRHPDLSGINLENATVVIPRSSNRLIRSAVEQWIALHPVRYSTLLEGQSFDGEETERLRRQSVLRTEVLPKLAYIVIHEAKSSGLTPEDLWKLNQQTNDPYETLAIAAGLYEQYQAIARVRNFIDYDDMILAALRVLNNDAICKMWQKQYFAVFEDEAQDSTQLQYRLLQTLATDPNNPSASLNFIRVGDPNQAINSTFTPADPIYFNRFCEDCQVQELLATMDQAGRSSTIIIEAANFVLHWVNNSRLTGAELAFRSQNIRPVDADDPQPDANPRPTGQGLEIYTPRDIYHTVELIGERVIELFTSAPEHRA